MKRHWGDSVDRDPSSVLDEWLTVSAQAGSRAAFAALIRRWSPRLLRHAAHLVVDRDLAQDIVQDSWIGIARNLRRLDDPAGFKAWALAIVTRRAVDELRRAVRERRKLAAVASHPVEAARRDPLDDRLDLNAALERAPFDQRLLISLHYGQGLTVEEIAAAHGFPPGTVKSRLSAARQALKTFLDGGEHDPD